MIQIDKPMPDGCDVCPLMYDYIQCNALPEGCKDDDAFNEDGFDWTKRPEWCPLKEQDAVVRCKDCVNSGTSRCPCHYSGDPFIDWDPDDDWFCADGRRCDE